ncbi:MAG: glycoside hydrolase family 97 catalytic domain-containing protein [Bacteroides sp.]
MNKVILTFAICLYAIVAIADNRVTSPDGRLSVTMAERNGAISYSVSYDGQTVLAPSVLGLRTDIGDFQKGLTLRDVRTAEIDNTYMLSRSKVSRVHYVANELQVDYANRDGQLMTVTFRVSDHDVAFRYTLAAPKDCGNAVIKGEATAFNLVDGTSTFLCPQIDGQTGWMRTKPSYEEEYKADEPMATRSQFGLGYTFPCLFKTPDCWVLVSETGVGGGYCASHLGDYVPGKGYTVAYPNEKENNGVGSTSASIALPGSTPWRTITVGTTLEPIVETTIPWDVVNPLYEATADYKPGRYTWSWLLWQDNSANYDDQKQMVDLSATMGYEYVLVDALWDVQMGRQRMAELSRYAQSKGVSLILWYNSNGVANDAPQSPRHCMNTAIARDREMAWLQSIGVKGIKVDFFGGDKQETMRLYEDILYDANRYGIQVIFHGCTLPRGWERMYPNYVSSEAVLASENVFFTEHHARHEAEELTMHPFCRNTVGAMDWGGTIMNRHMSRDNKSRHRRYTSDVFEIAAAIVNQASIQCIALYPNNLAELPQAELDLLREIPTTWDETRLIDGYPMKYAVIARRHAGQWWIAGLNAGSEPRKLTLDLPMLAGKTVRYYTDKPVKGSDFPEMQSATLKVSKQGKATVTIQPNGGILIIDKPEEEWAYVFSYFDTKKEDAGLCIAYSYDGYHWTAINDNKPVMRPTVGKDKLLRDPSLCLAPDGTFHLVWTSSWTEPVIGHATSRDLVRWSEQQTIPVMADYPTTRNAWAPELFYDEPSKQYYIYWASTVPGAEGVKTEGCLSENDYNHRIYATTTRDFKTFTKTRLYYNPDFNAIDAAIVRDPKTGELLMAVKNENLHPAEKNIRIARARTMEGGFSKQVSAPIHDGKMWCEGPAPLYVGNDLLVYYDMYGAHRFGASRSRDQGLTWEDVTDKIRMPEGMSHGTAIAVPKHVVDELSKY